MLAENETLFVEHKGDIQGDAFQVAKAVCSFANTLGGWLLIGVTEGKPNAGTSDGWEPIKAHAITDRVRQALATNRVDPIPPFAATTIDYGDTEQPIGVVRVYESIDTPHVMGNGQVFVRSVAEDRDLAKRYRPGGVDTQAALVALAERGRTGIDAARGKLDPRVVRLAASSIGIEIGGFGVRTRDALVGIRAIPVTPGPFADWSVSQAGYVALQLAAIGLARADSDALRDHELHASGLTVRARSEDFLAGVVAPPLDGVAAVGTDQAGVVVATMQFGVWQPSRPTTSLTLNGVRDHLFLPLLESATSVLETAEAYGRVLLELRVGHLEQVITVDDEGGPRHIPGNLPLGGEISLPLTLDRAELRTIAERWKLDAGRAAGYFTLLP